MEILSETKVITLLADEYTYSMLGEENGKQLTYVKSKEEIKDRDNYTCKEYIEEYLYETFDEEDEDDMELLKGLLEDTEEIEKHLQNADEVKLVYKRGK